MNNDFCVLTTVNLPTKAIEVLHEKFGSNLIVVGDVKTPVDWNYKDAQYILDLHGETWYEGYAPKNHYARKNLGYLEAMRKGAELIYDTDDDNTPNEKWKIRMPKLVAHGSLGKGWFNVYETISDEFIWPRGFSLRHLHTNCADYGEKNIRDSSIQQGLADGEPDVDAIWRLVYHRTHDFTPNRGIYLHPDTWCPFNSQSTWWFPKAFVLMYLPVNASFRMTDIWRSFIAQRCLWEINEGVTFHSPSEVFQDRNEHDLLKDFEDEIPGYLHNDEIVEILSALKLETGEENICNNLLTCYQALVDKKILPEIEIRSVKAWIKDYGNIKGTLR